VTLAGALAAALVVEHQAIYGYGVAGAHLGGRPRADALAALDVHRLRRDRLAALLGNAGATPPAAAPAYALPSPVRDGVAATALCATLEDACAGAAWDLAAASPARSAARDLAVRWLAQADAAAVGWRGAPGPALPGQPR
jgi:hypothetical protein